MKIMIEIKKLPITRYKEYKALRLEALKSDPTAFGSAYSEEKKLKENEWKRRLNSVLFVLSDNKPVGMIGHAFYKGHNSHIAYIFGFYVNRKYRGQGIGRELLKSVLDAISKNKKIIKIELSVNTEQVAAIRLYEKNGFLVVGRFKKELKVNNRFFDEFTMEKML